MATASFVTDLTEILTQAAEAAAGIASIYSGFKILDIAENYYDLYKDQREFYYSVFQAGVETPLAAEVYVDPIPVLDYNTVINALLDSDTGPMGGASGDAQGWWSRHAPAYGAPLDPRLQQEYDTRFAATVSDWTNYLFRFAEMYYDVQSDIRWKKRLQLHNIGIKEGTAVASALNSSLGQYENQLQDYSNMLAAFGNGIAQNVGYKKGLSDTADDFAAINYNKPSTTQKYLYTDNVR